MFVYMMFSAAKDILYVFVHSDEELKLETVVFESFRVANLPYRPCGY